MRNILLSLVLLFAAISSVLAQELTVKSFKLASSDLTAQTQHRKDLNDCNCALIKVGIGLQGVQFEGSIMGNVENKTGEYWVYMPQGNRQLKVKHANYAPVMVTFADYGVEKLESNRTYELIITASGGTQVAQKQRLTIRYSPSSATVLVDNKMVKGTNGVARTTLSVGQHSFVVACDGYESEEGTVKLKASAPSNIQITLTKEAMATQQSIVSQPIVAQQPVVQAPIANSDHISIPVKDGISIDMVRVEAGTFTMGATAEMKDPLDEEKPTHRVTLTNDYYIGKYEVTQALWKAVMGNNPSYFKGDNLPVEKVSWDDCQEFISQLNRITGKTFRLPTEAEWEYAARGGKKSCGYQYSGSNDISDVAWCLGNSGSNNHDWGNTHAVGTKQGNELGIYDMSGNVFEWCQDRYGRYDSSSQVNPTGANSESYRVRRGGSWFALADWCRSSSRFLSPPDRCGFDIGLRLVLSE